MDKEESGDMCNEPLDTPASSFAAGTEAFLLAVEKRREVLREKLLEIFSGTVPIVLEIGAGHGHFLNSYAAAHPDGFCVGVDLMSDRVRRATKKRDRFGLANLEFVQAEAAEFLDCLPPGIVFHRVFVLFPDPWPKKRHHKNRLLSESFLTTLADRCGDGAELYFRTDFEPYFQEVRKTVEEHPRWKGLEGGAFPYEEPTVFQQRAEVYFSLVAQRLG